MTPGDRPDPALEQATEWLLRVRNAPADPALRQQVETWVAADVDHARAWDQARRAWRALGHTERAAPVVATLPRGQNRACSQGRARPLVLAVSALAACLALVLLPDLSLRWRADHRSAIGEIRTVRLEDGSQVQLAPHSALRTRFRDGKRQIELLRGQAFFQVAHDPAHPFVVTAGPVTATALGTAFDVRLGDDVVAVTVETGRVAVADAASGHPLAEPLSAGTRAVLRPGAAAVVDAAAPGTVADWRDGTLFFVNASVAEVAAAVSAYHPGWVVVADPALAATQITGLYDPRDKDRALRALVRPAKGRVLSLGLVTVLTGL